MPVAVSGSDKALYGRSITDAVTADVVVSTTHIYVRKYDGTAIFGNSKNIAVGGFYNY